MTDHNQSSAASEAEIARVHDIIARAISSDGLTHSGLRRAARDVYEHMNDAAQPPAAASDDRKTITVPPGYEDVRDADGRATGEVRKIPTDAQPAGEPIAWCGWHPKHGWALQTAGHDQQHASSLLMRTDIAGNHGWTVQPLYASQPAPAATVEKVAERYFQQTGHVLDMSLLSGIAAPAAPAATVETARSDGKTIGEFYGDCRPSSSAGSDAENWARLGASEYACYRWPEDTSEHRAMRAAFMDGAAHAVTRTEPQAAPATDALANLLDIIDAQKRDETPPPKRENADDFSSRTERDEVFWRAVTEARAALALTRPQSGCGK